MVERLLKHFPKDWEMSFAISLFIQDISINRRSIYLYNMASLTRHGLERPRIDGTDLSNEYLLLH